MDRSLSPRDAADKLGISPDTLRRWEREGLIHCERTPGGQRRYREEEIASMLDGRPSEPCRRPMLGPPAVRSLDDAAEQAHSRPPAPQVAPWERRVREEQADLEVTRIRSERAALLRAERAERETRERAANDVERSAATRAAQRERIAAFEAAQEKRLNELRAYGKVCAVWAPAEYQANVVRDLLSSVDLDRYPPDLPDHLARVHVNARVEKLLKPWRDGEARKRAKLESQRKLDSLVLIGKWHAQIETRQWDRRAADRANREVDRALRDELDPDWTNDDVRDLVDDVLDEWIEE
jgi:DNA-binding transcriptional MerR regulator